MEPATEKQISYIAALMARVEARKPHAPKKVNRWNDPVRAHEQKLAKIVSMRAEVAAGMTKGSASTMIDTLQFWAK